uniref:Uncharacterized protein n=1 Tax=Peronospora matthiolae TaxID=2874970 RepID=A0AAV1T5D5_9STRA
MNLDVFKGTEDTVGKQKIKTATHVREEERLMQFLKASALDVDGTDTNDRSVVT